MFVNIVAKEKKLRQERSQFAGGRGRRRHPPQLHNDFISLIEVFELLRVVTDFNLAAPTNLSRQRRQFSQNGFQECGLARAVWSDDPETVAAPQNQRNVSRESVFTVTYGSI